MNKRSLLSCCAFISFVLATTSARALTVFDPLNYSQNVLIAARSLEEINNQIRQLQNEAAMLENMAKNLSSLDYSALSHMTGALSRISVLMNQANGLSFDLSQLENQWEQQYPRSYEASISTSDAAIVARQRWQHAMDSFQRTVQVQAQIVQNVQSDQSILIDLVNQSQNAVGALQAQQAVSQLVALSVKQQMQIQEMMAVQYRAEAQDAARKAQVEEAACAMTKRFLGDGTAYSGRW